MPSYIFSKIVACESKRIFFFFLPVNNVSLHTNCKLSFFENIVFTLQKIVKADPRMKKIEDSMKEMLAKGMF